LPIEIGLPVVLQVFRWLIELKVGYELTNEGFVEMGFVVGGGEFKDM
jgi:hypothetical protein